MDPLIQQLIAQSTAREIALQLIVGVLDEIRPGSRERILHAIDNAAGAVENELLSAELAHLFEAL